MRLYNETRNMFGNTDPWKKYEWALGIVSLLSGCLSITIVPFLRKDFGERYLGWINLYFGYSVLLGFMFLGAIAGAFFPQFRSGPLMTLFWLGFIAAALYHRRQITKRNNAGIDWHSMYMGSSLLTKPLKGLFSEEKIYKFIEPGGVMLLGFVISHISGLVGLWLMFSGLALFINNHIVYFNERQAILDMRDSQIQAQYLGAALRGMPAQETAGFVVAESIVRLVGKDARLQDAFGNLSMELKELIDSPPDFGSGNVA